MLQKVESLSLFKLFLEYIFRISIVIGITVMGCIYIKTLPQLKTPDPIVIHDTINVLSIEPFTPNALKEYLIELHVKHPDIVYAQAVLETGNFKNKWFTKHNNLFSLKVAKSRATTATNKDGYAHYGSWKESVIDYALYQSAILRNKTKDEYLIHLGKHYAEDTLYVAKLKRILNY